MRDKVISGTDIWIRGRDDMWGKRKGSNFYGYSVKDLLKRIKRKVIDKMSVECTNCSKPCDKEFCDKKCKAEWEKWCEETKHVVV